MSLRPYQQRAIEQVRAAIRQGSRAVCLVMPTGAGKTRTCAEIVRSTVERGGRALWLAHRAELVDQAVGALSGAGLQVGCISASATSDADPNAPVQVATVQTLLARDLRPEARVIVVDEAHHYVADTFCRLVRDYPNAYVIGPTATPERSDGVGLGALFTRIVLGVRVRELVADGHLVPARLVAPPDKLRSGQIAVRPADAYLQHARGRRAIVFSPTVALAEQHAEDFRAAGLRSAVVSGDTPWEDRRAAFAALQAGTLDALCNVYVATEGLDVPEVDCVILARGFGSSGTYLQCVGRALRPAANKRDALILDLTGTSHAHGHPEDDRIYSLEGRGIRGADAIVDQSYCRVCGAPTTAGEVCAECGTAPVVIEQRVTGAKLIPYENKRREPDEQRAATLRRWRIEGASRGYSPRWATAKYRAVYGAWPSGHVLSLASEAA